MARSSREHSGRFLVMERKQAQAEERRYSHPPFTVSLRSLNSTILSSSIGFSLLLASFVVVRSQSLKPLSTAVKLADSAIKGTAALHAPAPRSLVLASKALVTGYKASKRFIPSGSCPKIPDAVAARLKACLGAVNLLRFSSSPLLADGSLGIGFLKSGYKVSKNSAKVIEGFVGLQLNSAIRDGLDALGFLVRAATVGREIKRWISIEWPTRDGLEYRFPRRESRHRLRSSYKRLHFEAFRGRAVAIDAWKFPQLGGAVVDEINLDFWFSELLCLSIPVNEVTLMPIKHV